MGAMVSRDGGVLGAAILLALGGVLVVGAAWLARRRCLPSELGGAAAGEVKLQAPAGDPAAVEAQLELAVEGAGSGGADCCPTAVACTSTSTGTATCTAGGGAADRLKFERGWAMNHAMRKKIAPERYSQFDLD